VRNRYVRLFGRELIWQPVLKEVWSADLVIAEQASKLLVNYVLQIASIFGGPKFAFWGHGKNFQEHAASRLGEFIKRFMSRHVHWWFAYNTTSAQVVRALPFPENRITAVQNAIDTRELVAARARIRATDVEQLKQRLGLHGRNICIFAGGMYREKRLDFLVSACKLIREQIPDFEMLFIGSGVDAPLIESAAALHPWLKYVGPKFGDEKVLYFALAKLELMPGLVGLGVLDSFALEVPLVTTNVDYHSPEIEYLRDGYNGIVVREADDASAYASVVGSLLAAPKRIEALRAGCRESRDEYTVEEMVRRFANGVRAAIG
ncbi:MAG TPA: glycosyltransferase family 4 protein, partial [Gemmatimonadaceae bacterium]|nr:glycosyltransferase family 4 protein [Gemmatimonadaceae bacterium]